MKYYFSNFATDLDLAVELGVCVVSDEGSGNYFWGVRGARQRRPSAGMIAPPILASLASGNGARSARGFRERKQAFRKRANALSFSRKLKRRERPLARTTIRVTSSSERFSGKRSAIS